jgi:hypothetical protein
LKDVIDGFNLLIDRHALIISLLKGDQ